MTGRHQRILKWLAIAGVVVVAIGIAAWVFGPRLLHRVVERAASRALGRELSIAGPFELSFSLTPKLTAGDVSLANLPWGSEPQMIRARRLTLVVDLVSLWSRPVRVRELEIDGARLLLERDGDGRGNWVFALPPSPPREPGQPPPLEIARATIRGFELVYRKEKDAEPTSFGVEELAARLDPHTRMIDLDGNGLFRETPWDVAGQVGTLESVLAGHDLDQTLSGRLGESKIEIRGRLREPFLLGGPNLDLRLEGPDFAAAAERLGVHSTLSGAYRLQGRLTSDENGVGVDAHGSVGELTMAARGVVSALATFDRFDLRVEAAGPDAAEFGSRFGVKRLPPTDFELAGRLRREDGRLWLDGVDARLGTTAIHASGELGGAGLALRASGADLSLLSSLARVRLPQGKFELEGTLVRRPEGLAIEAAELRSNGMTVQASGSLGQSPRFVGTDLALRASGGDLSVLSNLARLRLPPEAFELEGRLLRREDGFAIDAAELRTSGATIRATGRIGQPPRFPELALTLEAAGPNLAPFSETARVELPARPFELSGGLARDSPAWILDGVKGRLDDATLSADGRLLFAKRLAGTDLRLRVAGPDLERFAWMVDPGELPAEPFDVKGRLRIAPTMYRLDDVEAEVGRITATGTGRISAPSARRETSIAAHVEGEALAELAAWGLPEGLPADRFSIDGRLRIADGVYAAEGVVAQVGADRASVDGVLGALPDLALLDAVVDLSGPSLVEAARVFSESELTARLPAGAYAVSGRVRRQASGYRLDGVRAQAAGTTLQLEGSLGTGEELRGTELRFDAEGPDAALLAALAGTRLPAGRFAARGKIARVDAGYSSEGLTVAIGELRLEASGTLGARREVATTDLRIDLSGPVLADALRPFTERQNLPTSPFKLGMEIAGSADRLASKSFSLEIGENDLSGRIALRLEGKPFVEAELRSRHLDLSKLLAELGENSPNLSPANAGSPPVRRENERRVPDAPLSFAALRKLDATLRFEAAELIVPGPIRRDVVLTGELRDGALRVDRLEGSGLLGGRTDASLTIEPVGDGYRMHAVGRLQGGRLVVPSEEPTPANAPSVDLEFDLRGEGRSFHELAAASDGYALVVVGPGELRTALGESMTSGVGRSFLNTLLPYRETSDRTAVECGIALAMIADGTVEVEPIALRTDKVTATGIGRLDFDTEEIDLSWKLKQHLGAGLSAGEISNSYVKLAGTLASPHMELKPLEALTAMGAAVATAGLTTISKGVLDRLTVDEKVCAHALKQARERMEKRGAVRP